jgi:hypothetical protein
MRIGIAARNSEKYRSFAAALRYGVLVKNTQVVPEGALQELRRCGYFRLAA